MEILWPAFGMFALSAMIAVTLVIKRFGAVGGKRVDPRFYALYRDGQEPDDVAVFTRHYINLFEQPVLFYCVIVMAYATGLGGGMLVGVAWAYVAARYLHSAVHLFGNNVLWRVRVFALSWAALATLWVILGLRMAQQAG
jgi:hypothetical protein